MQGSRQFKDFEDYLVPPAQFAACAAQSLPLAVDTDCEQYLRSGWLCWRTSCRSTASPANDLPDATITERA